MGVERNAKKLRLVLRALPLGEVGKVEPSAAAQYRVRPRTLRRAILLRATGTASIERVCHAYGHEARKRSFPTNDTLRWAEQVRLANPSWTPGDPVPA